MNRYKLEAIIKMVRDQGRLPTDQWDEVLEGDDLLVWFGLDNVLTANEKVLVKMELAALADAEACMDQLRVSVERRQ